MNRKQADVAVGVLIASILLLGVTSAVQLHLTDGAMGGEMDSAPVIALVGPVLMSLVVASIVGGGYMFVRSQLFAVQAEDTTESSVPNDHDATDTDDTVDTDDAAEPTTAEAVETRPSDPVTQRQILDVLPDDERRILEPVLESPGLTQIEVRDRSGFSKSKVSQTITDLEKRGLLYRESQGRTYRVYPADDIGERI